jgi:molybdopterin-guanine dinucleotide biosynthesis protein MobB
VKVFGITGWKNSGKTTLVAELLRELLGRGYRVSTVKHAHCDADVDRPGTDSYKHREAGAHQVLLATAKRWALMRELEAQAEPELEELLQHLDPVDLVIVEGFKMGDHPKLQVVRPENHTGRLPPAAQPIVAVASDSDINPADYGSPGPLLPLDDVPAIADFILAFCGFTDRA